MTTEFTAIHLDVLTDVRDWRIVWRSETGPFGGFARVDSSQISLERLVALYELRHAGFISVDKTSGRLAVTATGMQRLARDVSAGWQPAS